MFRLDLKTLTLATAMAASVFSPAVSAVPKVVFLEDFGATW